MKKFTGLSLREFPIVEALMPRENSYHGILLGAALGRTFHQEQWQDLIDYVSIHKLNYRKVEMASKNPMGYYWHVMKEFE